MFKYRVCHPNSSGIRWWKNSFLQNYFKLNIKVMNYPHVSSKDTMFPHLVFLDLRLVHCYAICLHLSSKQPTESGCVQITGAK
jgi:hypothetical protein